MGKNLRHKNIKEFEKMKEGWAPVDVRKALEQRMTPQSNRTKSVHIDSDKSDDDSVNNVFWEDYEKHAVEIRK